MLLVHSQVMLSITAPRTMLAVAVGCLDGMEEAKMSVLAECWAESCAAVQASSLLHKLA